MVVSFISLSGVSTSKLSLHQRLSLYSSFNQRQSSVGVRPYLVAVFLRLDRILSVSYHYTIVVNIAIGACVFARVCICAVCLCVCLENVLHLVVSSSLLSPSSSHHTLGHWLGLAHFVCLFFSASISRFWNLYSFVCSYYIFFCFISNYTNTVNFLFRAQSYSLATC